jgi:hypothetical protein
MDYGPWTMDCNRHLEFENYNLDLPKFYFRPYEFIGSRGELH